MHLGAFSMSLNVKDLAASVAFYENIGFEHFHGTVEDGWMMLHMGGTVLGLFEGIIEKNMLTFNPGWDQGAQPLAEFTDVRDIQKMLKANGIEIKEELDESTSGPGEILVIDPDGNPVLIDQHV
jgi:catechol 2,3-dioxygenase-like lactoylglutathione lyase family enzyme